MPIPPFNPIPLFFGGLRLIDLRTLPDTRRPILGDDYRRHSAAILAWADRTIAIRDDNDHRLEIAKRRRTGRPDPDLCDPDFQRIHLALVHPNGDLYGSFTISDIRLIPGVGADHIYTAQCSPAFPVNTVLGGEGFGGQLGTLLATFLGQPRTHTDGTTSRLLMWRFPSEDPRYRWYASEPTAPPARRAAMDRLITIATTNGDPTFDSDGRGNIFLKRITYRPPPPPS